MAGWLTNGMPVVGPITTNGTTVAYSQITNNGTVVNGGTVAPLTQVPAAALLPMDVPASQTSYQPETAAVTAFQIAAHTAGLIKNNATSTAGAATLNTKSGLVTTEALTTAAGANYSFVLTNSLIVSASSPIPQVQVIDGTNTTGSLQVTSVTNASGTSTFVFTNTGTAALNGTLLIAFHV